MVKTLAIWAAILVAPTTIVSTASAHEIPPAPISSDVSATDVLSEMFAWWNGAFKKPGAYNRDNFDKFFTEDATLVLEGRVIIDGIEEWVSHFNAIQSHGGAVEIVVPFKEVFEVGDRIYTYHVIRSLRQGVPACSLAAGYATLRGGKISSIVLVRASLDLQEGRGDPQCWTG